MLTLAATDFLSASAGTAGVITFSAFGDTIVTGADTFSLIEQSTLSNTVARVVPTNASPRLLKTLTFVNTSASVVSDIRLFANGTAGSNRIISFALPANGSAKFDANGLSVYDASGSLLTFGLNGRGISTIVRTAGTGAVGTTDTYTITYSDNTTSTFTVTNGSSVIVGATTVVTPVTNPSVTDADAGGNVDLRFNLPRARNLTVGPTTTVTPVTNPSVNRATDANGDLTDTFSLPRARVVAAGTTTTGAAGTNAAVTSAQDANGDVTLNFTIPRGDTGATGATGPAGQSVAVSEEGTQLTAAASSINVVGLGALATNSGSAVTVNVVADAYFAPLYGISPGNTGAANRAAFNALYATIPVNSTLHFPAGTYDFDGELTLNRNVQMMFRGEGKSRSILRLTNATSNLFFLSISAYYYSFEELGFAATVTKTAGAFIGTNSAAGDNAYLDVRRCEFKNHFVAINLSGIGAGNVGTISEVLINSPVANSVGIRINGENINMMLTNVTINHNPGAEGLGTCVEVLTSGAVQFVGCDFIGGQRTLDVNPTVSPVSALFFTNCFFDQAGETTVLFRGTRATSRVKFLQCGITNGNVANSVALSIAGTGTGTGIPEALDFELCDFYNSFAGLTCTGLSITGVRGIDIRNCRIAGFTVGIDITPFSANGVTKFNIQGNTIGPTENFPGNGTGIRVNAGAVQYGSYIITDNDLSGNTVAPLVENGTVAATSTEIVTGNIGLVSPPQNLFVNTALPLTTVTRLGAAVAAPANGQRVGTRGRITVTLHKSAATASTLTITLRNGVNNANTDAAVATLALGAGTAATGAATIIAEWQVVTATTAMATIMVKNNGATGVTNAAATNVTTLGPIAITNINTASFWGLYGSVATAANIIIDTVSYEMPSQ